MTDIKTFSKPDKSWLFLDGSKRSVIIYGDMYIGRGKYKPGWQWSKHIGAQTGKKSEAHTGYIVSGHMCVKNKDGKETRIGPGEVFHVSPGHDAWVVGEKTCVALDFGNIK
jgi:hypothetical protein